MPDPEVLQREELRVAPLDSLEVRVFGVEALNGTYQVDQNGMVKLPLIDEIQASGLTPTEVRLLLEDRLGQDLIRDPNVSVLLKESKTNRLTIEGTVAKPGLYPVRGDMSLLQMIAEAGGLREGANSDRILVFRTIQGQRQVAAFDLNAIRRGRIPDPTVYSGDVIVVESSAAATAYRELLRTVPLIGLFVIY